MKKIAICTKGMIFYAGLNTTLGVHQGQFGTIVSTREVPFNHPCIINGEVVNHPKVERVEHEMPYKRYRLSSSQGTEKVPGVLQFEKDILELLHKLKDSSIKVQEFFADLEAKKID